MAYQTPQAGGKEPFTSLLFTPKTGDGIAKQGSDYRTPRARSPTATGFGTMSRFAGRDSTPQTRRRSLTPASSMARDTPPPPPMDSLMDVSEGASASLTVWQQQQQQQYDSKGAEDMVVSTSPFQQQRDLARASHQLEQYEDTLVTVFGFSQDDVPLILREFGKCGDIKQFGTFGEGSAVNWIHLNFANKHAAQRALLRNGDQLSHSVMVGVSPLGGIHRQAVERYLANGSAAGTYAMPFPKPPAMRPYMIEAKSSQATVVPLPARTTWSKISEFVFGL